MRIISQITGRSRHAGGARRVRPLHAETPGTPAPSHRRGDVDPGNYYAGHHKDPGRARYGHAIGPDRATRFLFRSLEQLTDRGLPGGYNGNGPAKLALAMLTDYFGANPGGKALAESLSQPFLSAR